MTNAERIIEEARTLSVDERLAVVDSLLRSVHSPDPTVEEEWADVARRRLDELQSGQQKAIPADQVFAKLNTRFPSL
ncbi:MAG: addiction module protein [Candidatus Hydrogenedentes bacterium]|nr:addiction module protein [Candidatus Hydrogenedentota bacterium]